MSKKSNPPPFTKEQLTTKYIEFGSYKKAAEHFNCTMSCIRKYCAEWNVPHPPNYRVNTPLGISKEELLPVYEKLQCAVETAKYFSCSETAIRGMLREYDIPFAPRKHEKLNHNFFGEDTEATFYWAGFIAADGCITLPKKEGCSPILQIKLSTVDIHHLEKFRDAIGAENKIYSYVVKNKFESQIQKTLAYSSIHITSTQFEQDFKRFNIVPHKTATYDFPEWLITHSLVKHFMRGYLEGDGTISKCSNYWRLSLIGNESFITTYQKVLMDNLPTISKVGILSYKDKPNLYRFGYGQSHTVNAILPFLYDDAVSYLDRKYAKAQEAMKLKLPT